LTTNFSPIAVVGIAVAVIVTVTVVGVAVDVAVVAVVVDKVCFRIFEPQLIAANYK